MASETYLQQRLQVLIRRRGGYIPKKNHGNMITIKGLHDLPFTYKGFSIYWEVKTFETRKNVSVEQGIHCRLARKAGAITAIVSNLAQGKMILDHLDYCVVQEYSPKRTLIEMDALFESRGLDNGTTY